jgi:hypothetical protein
VPPPTSTLVAGLEVAGFAGSLAAVAGHILFHYRRLFFSGDAPEIKISLIVDKRLDITTAWRPTKAAANLHNSTLT